MIHVAPRLERRRRCLAMLVPRVAAYRDVEKKARPGERSRTTLGWFSDSHTRVCSSVLWVHIRKSLCERGMCFLTVAPTPDRRNKPSAFCWTATVFFFPPSQNGSRAVGSLAVQSRSVSAEGRGKPPGLPSSLHSAEAGSLRSCYGWRSSLAPVNGEQPCGLKKQRGCHRNARLSPRLARVWHTWRGGRSSRRSGEEFFFNISIFWKSGDVITWLFQRGVVSRCALLLGGDATTKKH